jgi:hypothetical protein
MSILTKKFLLEHYQKLGKSLREISSETGIRSVTIGRALNKYNIPKRTCGTRKGKKNKNITIKKDDIFPGCRYGMLVVKHRVKGGLLCVCDCGNEKVLKSARIRLKQVKSCGCLHKKSGKDHHLFMGYEEIAQSVFNKIRAKAIDRNLSFSINIQELYGLYVNQNKLCAISGVPIKFKKNHKDEQTASLDRIDSNKPYTLDNVQWVHKKVNTMKWNLKQEEFLYWCKIIHNYHK